ncbi:multidrug effflux MFS transporter [Ferrovibrio sp.]|uniref:multidrug effflux MFS transporter n=1 Tax=Ferrovibrio sp. TaxID=1917215 RepID=UPI00311E1D90
MSKSQPPAGLVPLLTILFANGILAGTMYLPSLPTIGVDLEVSGEVLPLTLTAFFATYAGGQLIYGPLSDRYGRRPLLLGGLAVMVLGSVACALSASLDVFLWSRALQGLGAASAMAIGRAVVNDAYERKQAIRATSIISASLAVAPILSPLLGGLVEQYLDWRASFWISGGITAMVALVLVRRLPETLPARNGLPGPLLRGIFHSYRFLLTSRAFMTFGLLNLTVFAGLHGFNAAAPAVLIGSLEVDPVIYGLLMAAGSGGFFLGALLSSWLGRQIGLIRMIDLGVLFMAVGALGLAVTVELAGPSVAAIILLRIVWAVGMGLAQPNTVVAAVGVNPAALGAGAALSGFLQTTGGGLGSAVNVLFPAGDALSLGVAFGGTALAGMLIWLGNRRAAAGAMVERT